MINDVSALAGTRSYYAQMLPAALAAQRAATTGAGTSAEVAAKKEFMTIFYKELLKQAFQAPNLSINGEEDETSPFTSIKNDAFVDQLAQQLAQKAVRQSNLVARIK